MRRWSAAGAGCGNFGGYAYRNFSILSLLPSFSVSDPDDMVTTLADDAKMRFPALDVKFSEIFQLRKI